jgi:hypothetical protein
MFDKHPQALQDPRESRAGAVDGLGLLSVTLPFDLEFPARHLDAARRNVEVFTGQLLCPLRRPPLECLKLRL